MFNALNNIRAMMLEDTQRSRDMLLKLSELLRYSMNMSEKREVTLKEELDVVRYFLDLNKIQFEDRLSYAIDAEQEALSSKIPPMIVQILVENSVKHGVSALPGGGEINVKSYTEHQKLLIEVSNSGKWTSRGTTTREHNGIGLPNVRKRLKLLYGEGASLYISQENERVVARIEIPLHHG